MDGATDKEETGLHFGVLGPVQVTRGGKSLPLGGRQQRAVLAMLLAEPGTVVSVGRIGHGLWGQETPSGFVTTVQTYVFHLREVLEPGRGRGTPGRVLVTEPRGYRLEIGGSIVDTAVFEDSVRDGREALDRQAYEEASGALTRGLFLWRGEVLEDLADLEFAAPIAARLDEMRVIAQGLRIEAELALGRHAAALPEIDRLVAEHPLQEELHAQRITALYRLGRQSDALAAYREVRSRLHEELGIEPSRHLQELHQAVLAQDPVLDWKPPVVQVSAGTAGRAMPEVTRPAPPAAAEPAGAVLLPAAPGRSHLGGKRSQLTFAATAVLLTAGLLTVLVFQLAHPGLTSFPANSVGAVNDDGTLGESVRVGLSPDGLTYGAGSLWAANRIDGTVSRVDPDTRAVLQTITVGALPNEVTVTADDVWVVNFGDGTVTRINARTSTPVDRVVVGNQPVAIASGPSGVWVVNRGDDTIQRIDPTTGRADKAFQVGDSPSGIAVDDTAVWVCSDTDGTVSEFDPVSLQPGKSIVVGGGPAGIALTRDDVWVANQLSQTVTRIHRTTGAATTIAVGDGPHSVVVADGGVWVSNEYDATITRIDPSTNEAKRWSVGASPRGLAQVDGKVWVASGAFASTGHEGGTLRVVGASIPGASGVIDPAAVVDDPVTVSAQRFVYDGLLAHATSGGAASQSLVPDLALAVPRASNGDKTYAFVLRRGVRYSTGREVHAADFRSGLVKALTVGVHREYFAAVVGARQCIDRPRSCDLSAGVITDDATGRVTVNLVAPDPQLLHRLASFVYPVPPGTPTTVSRAPVPGTGPYMIGAYLPGKQFSLKRNPHFRQWSFAAQPAGYADVIDFRAVPDGLVAAGQVLDGRADVANLSPSTVARRKELARQHPGQYKSQVLAQTDFQYLNTRMAPFDDIRVRRALNYAVDRRRLAAIKGVAATFSATCQILPPNFPSYRRYCPYTTTGAGDGRYHGPDLTRAKELVRLSGTRGMTVTIQGTPADHEINRYFASVLRGLGYPVKLREVPKSAPQDAFWSPRQVQMASGPGWAADYPAGSSFYDAVFSCKTAIRGPGWYCNSQVERKAAQARAAERSDPGAAGRLWTQVDRLITDDAPVVALGNPAPATLIAERVGNYQSSPEAGPILSQMWVR